MSWTVLLVWALFVVPLGVTRAMQILLWDRITQRPRMWLMRRWNPAGFAMTDDRRSYRSYVLECPWCSSVWIGFAVSAGLYVGTTRIITLLVLTALAASLLAVLIDRAIDASRVSDQAIAAREMRDHVPAPPPAVEMAFDRAGHGASYLPGD